MKRLTNLSDRCTENDTSVVSWHYDSASVADVRLECKLRYEYVKLKAKGRLRSKPVRYVPASQHESPEATSVAMSSSQDLYVISPTPATIVRKFPGSPMTLNATFVNVHGVWASLPKRYYELLRIPRRWVFAPLHHILVLTPATKLPGKFCHMELEIPMLVKQHRRWPVMGQPITYVVIASIHNYT